MRNLFFVLFSTIILAGGVFLTSPDAIAKTVTVEIYKFNFIPAELILDKGDTVIWINKEKRQYHSVWFEQLGEPEPDYLFPGDSSRRTFNESGDFPYRCGPHPKMTGRITVQ